MTLGNISIAKSYFIHVLSSLHVGAGRGLGFIDLPIAREKVTNYPYVPGSAIKGVLADYHDPNGLRSANQTMSHDLAELKVAFGSGGEDQSNSGSIVLTDAKLICFPVRSIYGTFAWCTCPLVLKSFSRDLTLLGEENLPPVPEPKTNESMLIPDSSTVKSVLGHGNLCYLDDLDFSMSEDAHASKWAVRLAKAATSDADWQATLMSRFAIVDDDVFAFLSEHSTQVDTRVRIDDQTKTVVDGALWYEESLPAEALLSGIAWCGPIYEKGSQNPNDRKSRNIDSRRQHALVERFCSQEHSLQLGGKATVGRGQVRLRFDNVISRSQRA
jgi:CRISPR-associated protein Cmr4